MTQHYTKDSPSWKIARMAAIIRQGKDISLKDAWNEAADKCGYPEKKK